MCEADVLLSVVRGKKTQSCPSTLSCYLLRKYYGNLIYDTETFLLEESQERISVFYDLAI